MGERIFEHEIKCMMYSFGDARQPSSESAALVEEIVHKQITEVVSRASDITNTRGGGSLNVEDIMFLFRKDKDKLRRIIRHLQFKELARKAGSTSSNTNDEEEQADASVQSTVPSKKGKYSLDFLSSVNQIENYDEMDEVLMERMRMQDAVTSNMDVHEYLNYSECRLMTFHKSTSKFKDWLGIEQKLNQEVIEVFGYLAYETVREIVELSLLVKKDMAGICFDPSSCRRHLVPPDSNTPSELGSTATFSATPLAPQTAGSPPPTSPTESSPPPARGRKRKRKKSASEGSAQPSSATVVENLDTTALQPVHIREALRRHRSITGPLTPFATHMLKPTFSQRTLCL